MISKITLTLLILSLSMLTANGKSPFECEYKGFITCPQDTTCCKDCSIVLGYRCHAIIDGTCCNDGSVCPNFTSCNTEAKTCDPSVPSPSTSTLAFLAEPENTEKIENNEEVDIYKVVGGESFLPTERNLAGKSISTLTPQQLKDYFKGYLQGTHFLDGYPPCDLVNDSVLQTLKQMIDSFQNIKSIKDVSKLKELLPGMKNLLMSLILQAPSCYSSGKQIQDLFARLVAYVTIPTYPVSLGLHITGNIFKVFTMVSDYLSNFERRDAFENGVKAGEFLKFLMFWDFK